MIFSTVVHFIISRYLSLRKITRGVQDACVVRFTPASAAYNACSCRKYRLQTRRGWKNSTNKGKLTFFGVEDMPIKRRDYFCSHLSCIDVKNINQKICIEDTDLLVVSCLCLACTVLNVNQKISRF